MNMRNYKPQLLTDIEDIDDFGQLPDIQAKSISKKLDHLSIYDQRIDELFDAIEQHENIDVSKLANIIEAINTHPLRYRNRVCPKTLDELKYYLRKGLEIFGLTGNFNWINTSQITDMTSLFGLFIDFNGDISLWDVSNVTSMRSTFSYCSSFNRDISMWDVSNVTDMSFMFYSAINFNQDISSWNTSKCTNMRSMFSCAYSFNSPLKSWDVSNVTSMRCMFYEAEAFNQPIGGWDVSSVNDMKLMFYHADEFNQPIGDWDVSNVTDFSGMFAYAKNFNQPLDKWRLNSAKVCYAMFKNAESFNQNINDWELNNDDVNMNSMFAQTPVFNQPLDKWFTKVNKLNYELLMDMFNNAAAFDQNISNWPVDILSKITDITPNIVSTIHQHLIRIFLKCPISEQNKPLKIRECLTLLQNVWDIVNNRKI